MVKFYYVILAFLFLSFAGCATPTQQYISKPSVGSDFPAKYARILLERPYKFQASGCSVEIKDDEKLIEILADGGSLEWDRKPGVAQFKLTSIDCSGTVT